MWFHLTKMAPRWHRLSQGKFLCPSSLQDLSDIRAVKLVATKSHINLSRSSLPKAAQSMSCNLWYNNPPKRKNVAANYKKKELELLAVSACPSLSVSPALREVKALSHSRVIHNDLQPSEKGSVLHAWYFSPLLCIGNKKRNHLPPP